MGKEGSIGERGTALDAGFSPILRGEEGDGLRYLYRARYLDRPFETFAREVAPVLER
jgi:hypothetical protein